MTLKKRIAAFAATALMAVSAAVATVPANATNFAPDAYAKDMNPTTVYGDASTYSNAFIRSISTKNGVSTFTICLGSGAYNGYELSVYTPYGYAKVKEIERPANKTRNTATMTVTVSQNDIRTAYDKICTAYNAADSSKKYKAYNATGNKLYRVPTVRIDGTSYNNVLYKYNTAKNTGYLGFRLMPFYGEKEEQTLVKTVETEDHVECGYATGVNGFWNWDYKGFADVAIVEYSPEKGIVGSTVTHENKNHVTKSVDDYKSWFSKFGYTSNIILW